MVFSSILFLCVFLPIVLALYFVLPARFRNLWLLIASTVFYAWGEPIYVFLMLFTTVFDYTAGRMIGLFSREEKPGAKKAVLIVTVLVNIGLLGVFKYTDFLIGTINDLTGSALSLLRIALPIGISFYTFQTLSYVIDVYRGTVAVQKNFVDFAMFVTLFPQLIAGPIVRYSDIQNELTGRVPDAACFTRGVWRFLIGLGKKVLLANQIGALWTTLTGTYAQDGVTTVMAWTGAIAVTLQYYFDFSGYSDMAIGLGLMFGFHFPENFRYPYEAVSITDYWRRWHITLSSWFREYVYIPLGGNRKGKARQILNLLIVWTLTGLWHGANWNFLLWGLFFFVFLMLEKLFLLKLLDKLPRVVGHVYSLVVVAVSWVIFSITDLAAAGRWIAAMFGFGAGFASDPTWYYLLTRLPLFLLLALASTHFPAKLGERLKSTRLGETGVFVLRVIVGGGLLALCVMFLLGDGYNPFLYSRF